MKISLHIKFELKFHPIPLYYFLKSVLILVVIYTCFQKNMDSKTIY